MKLTRLTLMTIAVAICCVSVYADLRHGIADETLTGDVLIRSVDPDRILMAIDSYAAGGRDGVVDNVFSVRYETAFEKAINIRIDDATVLVHADRVVAFSARNRVAFVFAHASSGTDETFSANTQVQRFVGIEVKRLFGKLDMPPLPRQHILTPTESQSTGSDSGSDRTKSPTQPGLPIAPNQSSYDPYTPFDPWDPCSMGTDFCGTGGTGGKKPAKSCEAGGNPSVSCSITNCLTLMGGSTPGCSVSCPSGWYSCCYCDGSQSSCGCYNQ
ncbi:MAG TPA: hypothetical protein VJ276_11985 [Thermoanaerobaculia bacterium]|nr:hypothetical protein [Thermoanaerobaculia bacterium]